MHRLFIAASAALFLCLPAFAAESAASLTLRYDALSVGPSSAMRGQTFESGHLKITLTDGNAAPVMAGDEVVGLFFKGTGSYVYRSVDSAEAAVLTSNVRNSTKLKSEKSADGIVIRDNFEELFLWVAGRDFPKAGGDAPTSLGPAFTAHRHMFVSDTQVEPTYLFIAQKLDMPTTPAVRAEFKGTDPVVYVYDPVVNRSEKLYSLYKIPPRQTRIQEVQEGLWPVVLSEQLISHTRKQIVEPNFFLLDVNYTLVAEERDAVLTVTETILPHMRAQRVYRFDQYNTVYDDNDRVRQFKVRSVTDESGNALSFVHRLDELLVTLPQAAPANKPFKIKFDIAGDFLIHPRGDSYWELGAGESWFPQPPLNAQYYTVHSTIKVKKPYVPFGTGETLRRVEEGNYNVVENKIDKPVRFTVALAGKYSYEEETRNGLTIRVATYALKNARAMKQLTNLAFQMIQFYEPFLGPFPFKEYNIIEINDLGYGQAPPATMFITAEAFNPTGTLDHQLYSKGINHVFAHEIAHQYWGHVIKMASEEEMWVDEAFAEYSASLVTRQSKGKGEYKALENSWKADAKEANANSSLAMVRRLRDVGNDVDAYNDRIHLIYGKGPYVLAKLHEEIGDKGFLSFLRNFQARFAWKLSTTQDMIVVLQQLTGKDYSAFFEQNVWGTGLPQG